MIGDALFSVDKKYRYKLSRVWDTSPSATQCMFIGLNPSTATALTDDPTIRRCIRFSRDWGFGKLVMTNLYAFRATKPRDLHAALFPMGIANDNHLRDAAGFSQLVIAAWGADGGPFPNRADYVRGILRDHDLHILGLTKHGAPRHPLYMRADTKPTPWLP